MVDAAGGARVRVRVPASSANLGPGFDCFAAALGLYLELEVSESGGFELVTDLGFGLIYRSRREVHGGRRILGRA